LQSELAALGYLAAVQAGMNRNHAPMEEIFRAVLAKTLRG